MRNTVNILGVNIDNLTMDQALDNIREFLQQDKTSSVYTPNSEIIMEARSNSELKEILNTGDLVTADGAGVVLASKILSTKLIQKVSGFDLVKECLLHLDESYYLLGGIPGVAEKAINNISKDYPGAVISGYMHGYFKDEDEESIIKDINTSGASIVIVCLGAPKQEKWINKNAQRINAKVCMGVGGSIDVFAGHTKLAPEFMRKSGFEWLFRLYMEPRRFMRMTRLPIFVLNVIWVRLKQILRLI